MSRIIETPEDFLKLQRECLDRVKYYTELANSKLGLAMALPRVRFNLTGTTGGKACYQAHTLELHNTFLRENPDDYLINTVGHEIAHLAAGRKFGLGIKPHGSEWTSVCWYLGIPATRCHKYDLANIPTRLGKVRNAVRPKTTYRSEDGIVRATKIGKIIEFD